MSTSCFLRNDQDENVECDGNSYATYVAWRYEQSSLDTRYWKLHSYRDRCDGKETPKLSGLVNSSQA